MANKNVATIITTRSSTISRPPANLKSLYPFIANIVADMPVTPGMKRILNILLPTMLPIEISDSLWKAAIIEAANSGSEVPTATMLRPITVSFIPSFSAINCASEIICLVPKYIVIIAIKATAKLKTGSFQRPDRETSSSSRFFPPFQLTITYINIVMTMMTLKGKTNFCHPTNRQKIASANSMGLAMRV